MSVNEVKLQKAAVDFQVRGTGPDSSRTFAIGNEDHTLGNALRHVLIQNAKVGFAGYSVPHPADPVVHIRVQTNEPTTALQALQESCETLHKQCDIVLEKLEEKLPYVREDKKEVDAKLEQILQEELAEEMEDAGDEVEDDDDIMEE
jgi:DNA-directed RNA polymerase I and III subunit RPAC2